MVLAPDGRVVDVDLPSARRTESADDDAAAAFFTPDGHIRPLSDIEGAAMDAALARYDGSMSEAARRLEIGRSTLYRRTRGDADAA